MTVNDFATPTASGTWRPADSLGHLLVIEVLELVEHVATSYGDSEALRCTIHDITRRETYADALIFTRSIVGSLRSLTGQRVLVRLEQGKAKPGQNPPYVLTPRNGTPADVEEAMAYLGALEQPKPATRDPELQAALDQLLQSKTVKPPQEEQLPF